MKRTDNGRIYTGAPCACRRGIERDNCPACEGTGRRLDFQAMRTARIRERLVRFAREEGADLGAARTVADAIGRGDSET